MTDSISDLVKWLYLLLLSGNLAIIVHCYQVVMLEYEGGATVNFTMVGCTEPRRKRITKIFGTLVS